MDDDTPVQIQANVAMAIERFDELTDFDFGLDRQSVAWVEGFIERQRQRDGFTLASTGALPSVLGCFLGQAIAEATGAEWFWNEEHEALGIKFPNDAQAFPVTKVLKQFDNGLDDSVLSFYDVALALVATGKLKESD